MTGPTECVDVVVVGARVAGAPTAMLLARRGLRVVLVDRARFPSDAVSSHQVQVAGVAALGRWGLREAVAGDGSCAVDRVTVDIDGVRLSSALPEVDGYQHILSPRRTRLDALLLDAAREAGVEVRTRFAAEAVEWDAGRVVGLLGRDASGRRVRLSADLVVGADGKHSSVAGWVGAHDLRTQPTTTVALYAYWEGLDLDAAWLYHGPGRAFALFPTDDGRCVTYLAAPAAAFTEARRDPRSFIMSGLGGFAGVGEAVRAARPVERVRLTPDVPHRERQAHGPGWALVGDAAQVLDPVSAFGISHALLSAELLDEAVGRALESGEPLDARLSEYAALHRARFAPVYDLTASLARLTPRPAMSAVLRRVAADPDLTAEALAVFGGLAPASSLFSPRRLVRLLGARGLAEAALAELAGRYHEAGRVPLRARQGAKGARAVSAARDEWAYEVSRAPQR
jgi:2-polyprenyl-6-methoxyphenol hydroxylase-like FAD-dependent oxidoreductase